MSSSSKTERGCLRLGWMSVTGISANLTPGTSTRSTVDSLLSSGEESNVSCSPASDAAALAAAGADFEPVDLEAADLRAGVFLVIAAAAASALSAATSAPTA